MFSLNGISTNAYSAGAIQLSQTIGRCGMPRLRGLGPPIDGLLRIASVLGITSQAQYTELICGLGIASLGRQTE